MFIMFRVEQYFTVCMDHIWGTHSPAQGSLDGSTMAPWEECHHDHLPADPSADFKRPREPILSLSPCLSSPDFSEPGSGQVFVTSENQLVYYPSITYAIIGSSIIFVLVVALLALVLHHQRKRNNLMTLPVHRLQHPVLLSRLVVLDHPHHCNVTYNVNNGIQYVASQAEQNASEVGSPPSYSEALLDQRCVLGGRAWG